MKTLSMKNYYAAIISLQVNINKPTWLIRLTDQNIKVCLILILCFLQQFLLNYILFAWYFWLQKH